MVDCDEFASFLGTDVAARLLDYEGRDEFQSHLRGLAGTGFSQDSLNAILSADVDEERTWAVGEAMAEAWLSIADNIIWPWNMERDKRTPKASLPGADLVGFCTDNGKTRLVLGEVKTSGEAKHPPQIMSGRSGMVHQIEGLAHQLGVVGRILKWLWPRCKNTKYQHSFDAAIRTYLESGNKAVSLYGILIRDTCCNEMDLKSRGLSLDSSISSPTSCDRIALYIPFKITELPHRIKGASVS